MVKIVFSSIQATPLLIDIRKNECDIIFLGLNLLKNAWSVNEHFSFFNYFKIFVLEARKIFDVLFSIFTFIDIYLQLSL